MLKVEIDIEKAIDTIILKNKKEPSKHFKNIIEKLKLYNVPLPKSTFSTTAGDITSMWWVKDVETTRYILSVGIQNTILTIKLKDSSGWIHLDNNITLGKEP